MAAVFADGFGFPPQLKTSPDPENMLLFVLSKPGCFWFRDPAYLSVLEMSR